MSKIKKITVSNLKAISSKTADFGGCTALIIGGNNKGKTSFLKSLPDRLRGIKPDVILKHGESEGYAEWELTTGEKFIWSFENRTKAGEKLTFISTDNIKTSINKEISTRFFPETFDIDKFLNDTPAKQKKTLQEICGLDFVDIDSRYKSAFEDRTFKNKKLAEEKLKDVSVDLTMRTDELPLDQLQLDILGVDNHNEKISGVEKGITSRQTAIKNNEAEIKRLKDLIINLETENTTSKKQIDDGKKWLLIPENKKKEQSDVDALKTKLQDAKDKNEKIKANNLKISNKQSLKIAENAANSADKLVKSIETERQELIKSSTLPEGFSFTDDGISFEGFALSKEQLSSSKIYIAALKLAAMNIGEVKTLHFDASFLDKNSLKDIEEWAAKEDLQLLIERPDFEGGEIEYQLTHA
ncbi:ATP-binding protein [Pedobacter nyackensis]|uniref:AAA domain-containing protein n=1 Tax=Pedobacter nyackensis TaxID=475255 RepID=A0A1W1ZVT6_9SPHI|nr:hypothetical protein [Pedobacter nyackensis]SMC52517.1 hypothetical protein SAMN04488101_10190 [Pedobacter nyackensis]